MLIRLRCRGNDGVKQWRVFKNDGNSSPTTPFRRHLRDHHKIAWEQECTRLNIPINHNAEEEPEPDVAEIEEFTKDAFLIHLVEFVSSDDQVRSWWLALGGVLLTGTVVNKRGRQPKIPETSCFHGWYKVHGGRHPSSNEVYKSNH